jgi:hypothetical protein
LVQAQRAVSPGSPGAAQQWAAQTFASWGIRSPLLKAWLPALEQVGADCTLSFELDRDAGLLAVDLWQDGRRVWGLDDFLG